MTGTIIWIILNVVLVGAVGAAIVLHRHRQRLEGRQRAALDTIEDRLAELADIEAKMGSLDQRLAAAERALKPGNAGEG
jgi:hypothetical protein